jgi:protein prenyltransferase alpha subunit repeat containing protein 1
MTKLEGDKRASKPHLGLSSRHRSSVSRDFILMAGTSVNAYNAFRDCLDLSRVLAIEILPSDYPGFSPGEGSSSMILVDDSSIGVSKKVLVRAFITARQIVYKFLGGRPAMDNGDVLLATFVVLLFDPEHLTAANIRKRMLLEGWKVEVGGYGDRLMPQATKRELVAIETLLTSPLHRHTKSPTLWYHRRWVLRQWLTCALLDEEIPLRPDAGWLWQYVYRPELLMVMKAGEQHPRNYYAWFHARWVIESFQTGADRATLASSLADGMTLILDWCLKHESDTSGWSFLLFLYNEVNKVVEPQSLIASNAEKVLCLALNFDWDLESIWVFLRTVLASSSLLPKEQRLALTRKIAEKVEGAKEGSIEHGRRHSVRFMKKALEWIRLYGAGEDEADH